MLRALGLRSLAGQLVLVAALSLLLAQAINLALLVNGQRQERLSTIASGAAVQIHDVAARLAAGDPVPPWMLPRRFQGEQAQRGQRRGRMLPPMAHRVVIDTAPHIGRYMRNWPEMAQRVRSLIGAGAAISTVRAGHVDVPARPPRPDRIQQHNRPGGEQVAVAAQLRDGRWITVRAHIPDRGGKIGSLLIGQTLILFGLLLGPLLFVAWRVNRPLARLADAANTARLGQAASPLPETGPRDVRDLTAAFNAMRTRIWAMIQDKDRMLGAIGHDLRTPLTSLRVRVEQVKDTKLRDKLTATIEEMTVMLADILSLARAGQPRELAEATDLAAMVTGLIDEYQQMGLPVSQDERSGGSVIRIVRAANLRRAMRNLIDNAISYGGSASIGVEIMPDGAAILFVDDEGPGIEEGRISELMEPFARAESSRNRNTGGSGLGLALARAIAIAEGGEVNIRNRVPKGLSARIILPRQT